MEIKVIPKPKEIYIRGLTKVSESLKVFISEKAPDTLKLSLEEEFRLWNILFKYVDISEAFLIVGLKDEVMRYNPNIVIPERIGNEGYMIDISDSKAIILANSFQGLFYGVQTFRQLISKEGNVVILPQVLIIDYPTFLFRGFTDDVSRGPLPIISFAKQMIRLLAEFKINAFTHYMELHTFKFPSHPDTVWQDYFTPEEINELVNYCSEYFIDYFPSIQSFGHSRIILSNPKYSHLAEFPGSSLLSPAISEVYDFLKDVYSDVCKIYKSKYFNINCDETWDLGKGRSKEICEKEGYGVVYLNHIVKLRNFLKEFNKITMFWGDMVLKYKEVLNKVPKDMIVLNWTYAARDSYENFLVPIWRRGLKQIICPGIQCWRRIFPDYIEAKINISNFARDACKYNAMGVLTTSWDDDGENLQSFNWYGILLAAEAGWCGKVEDDFDERVDWAFFRSNTRISYVVNLLAKCIHRKLIGYDDYFWINPYERVYELAKLAEEAKENLIYLKEASEILSSDRDKVRRNKSFLDYIDFAIRRLNHVARKFIFAYELIMAIERRREIDKAYHDFVTTYEQLINEVDELEKLHRELWIRESKPNSFEKFVLARYKAYRKMLRELVDIVRKLDLAKISVNTFVSEVVKTTKVPYIMCTS